MDPNVYTNLNTNIRFTDDISFKLLGLVPLFSGSGILVALFKSESFWSSAIYAMAAFGALVTLGLFRWELRNIQTCKWLIECTERLEAEHPETFHKRPNSPMGIGKTQAEKLIYGVTILTWLLLPWLVYATARAKTNQVAGINQTLNCIYIAFAALVGIFTLVSIRTRVEAKPPAK